MKDIRDAVESAASGAGDGFRAAIDFSDDAKRYFRENYPILLDGALPSASGRGLIVREAAESLTRSGKPAGSMPAALLREALDSVRAASPRPATKAGLVAVGPRRARVWWDESLREPAPAPSTADPNDVLASLDNPKPVLRFYDVTGLDPDAGRWNQVFDIEVDLAEGGRTVEFWSADRRYVVEVGVAHADGRFERLARTNVAELPREAVGERAHGRIARSNLRPRLAENLAASPDAKALEWAEAAPDCPDRDIEAELAVHMLYRAFRAEGPRALRRAPTVYRREADVLRREYEQRLRRRERPSATGGRTPSRPAVLVARLDSFPDQAPRAPIAAETSASRSLVPSTRRATAGGETLTAKRFAYHRDLLSAAREGWSRREPSPPVPAIAQAASGRTEPFPARLRVAGLVWPVPADHGQPRDPSVAAPVHVAARELLEHR